MAKRKLTWIDFTVALVIIVSIAGIAYKFATARVAAPAAAKGKLLFTYYMENVPTSTIEAISEGDPVRDSVQGSSFGTVKEIITGEAIFWEPGADGQLVASGREGYSSLLLTTEAEGIINGNGVSIDKSVYHIGQTLAVYAGKSSLTGGRISRIVEADK